LFAAVEGLDALVSRVALSRVGASMRRRSGAWTAFFTGFGGAGCFSFGSGFGSTGFGSGFASTGFAPDGSTAFPPAAAAARHPSRRAGSRAARRSPCRASRFPPSRSRACARLLALLARRRLVVVRQALVGLTLQRRGLLGRGLLAADLYVLRLLGRLLFGLALRIGLLRVGRAFCGVEFQFTRRRRGARRRGRAEHDLGRDHLDADAGERLWLARDVHQQRTMHGKRQRNECGEPHTVARAARPGQARRIGR
jgi:hypothetical protein